MPTLIHEVKVRSTGFLGAPGWTTFYYDGEDPTALANQFRHARAYLDNVKGFCPAGWSAAVQTEGRLLQTATGFLDSSTTAPADGTTDPVVGTNPAGGFSPGGTGMCFSWTSSGVNRGRRVRGRTFLVPICSFVFDTDGTIKPEYLTGTAAAFLAWAVENPRFGIWSRPNLAGPGKHFPVVACRVTDQAAILSSRRT